MADRSGKTLALWLWLALGLAAGCSVESDGPSGGGGGRAGSTAAGTGGAPFTPPANSSGRIEIQGEPMLRLALSQAIELTVRVLNEDDEPERMQTVSFNLLGRPEDSSLSSLDDGTNSQGIATVTLRAASRPATFQVRASVGSDREATFSVSVSGAGFGTLVVHAPYEGMRAVSERFVLAIPNVTCEGAAYAVGDAKTVIAPGEDRATLVALPAQVPYAVLAIAESASDVTVALGCVDERCSRSAQEGEEVCKPITLATQGHEEITVPFGDLPLRPAPDLSLEMTLSASSTAAALGSAIRRGVNGMVRTTSTGQNVSTYAEGRFWLDSLDAVLRQEKGSALAFADELAEARLSTSSGPESSLSALLEVNDEGAGVAASAMASRVRGALDTLSLFAELAYERRGDEISVRTLSLEALPVLPDETTPHVDLSEGKVELDARLSDADDTLRLRSLRFAPRLGALAAEALERASRTPAPSDGRELRELAGCSSLAEWLAKQSFVHGGACSEGCIDRACEHGVERFLDAAYGALEDIDEQRPYATLGGSLLMTDGDGDLSAEQMSADAIEGLWEPAPNASLGDSLRGTAIAALPE